MNVPFDPITILKILGHIRKNLNIQNIKKSKMTNKERHLHFTINNKMERLKKFKESSNEIITNHNHLLMKIHFEKFHHIMYV